MSVRTKLVKIGDFLYYKRLEKELEGMKLVLDVACGSNSPISKIKRSFYSVGIDAFAPSIKESEKKKNHDEYKLGDALKIREYFKEKSFDCVVALDIIEHFKKKEGLFLIEQMEAIARNKVIIFTPYGFTEQHPSDGNPYQVHRSGWYIKDFRKRGYKVRGMRGFRFIRGEYATIKYRPWFFWGLLAVFSEYLVYFFPSFAYQIFAVKYLHKK